MTRYKVSPEFLEYRRANDSPTKRNVNFAWSKSSETVFKKVKTMVVSGPILYHYWRAKLHQAEISMHISQQISFNRHCLEKLPNISTI